MCEKLKERERDRSWVGNRLRDRERGAYKIMEFPKHAIRTNSNLYLVSKTLTVISTTAGGDRRSNRDSETGSFLRRQDTFKQNIVRLCVRTERKKFLPKFGRCHMIILSV